MTSYQGKQCTKILTALQIAVGAKLEFSIGRTAHTATKLPEYGWFKESEQNTHDYRDELLKPPNDNCS